MKTTSPIITNEKLKLRKLGHGPRPVLALHGFSRAGSIFGGLARRLENSHTIYAFDLPYHGDTKWATNRYTPNQLAEAILANVEAMSIESWDFLGHSLGGRILLKIVGQGLLPAKMINSLTLVAPDGLRGNYTGKLDILPSGMIKALAWAGSRPDALMKLANFLHRRGLFDVYTLNYLTHHLRDERTQRMLLGSFRSLPAFRLSSREQRGLAQLNVPVQTFIGHQDPLMNFKAVERWFTPLENARVDWYQGHHSLPVEVLVRHLTEI